MSESGKENKAATELHLTNNNKNLQEQTTIETTNSPNNLQAKEDNNHKSTLDEFFLNNKKLKEAETQLKSLSLILENRNSGKSTGLDFKALKESKRLLEQQIEQLKQNISKKDLKKFDVKCFMPEEKCANEIFLQDEINNEQNTSFDENESISVAESSFASSLNSFSEGNEFSEGSTVSEDDFSFANEEQASVEYLRDQNTRLRRRLSETRQQHRAERNRVMEQLRMLEIETVDGEKNWANGLREKQIELGESLKRNLNLLTKNEELKTSLKNNEKIRKKEVKQYENKLKKKERLVIELKDQLSSIQKESEKLQNDLKEAQRKVVEGLKNKNTENIEKINAQFSKCQHELKNAQYENEILRTENSNLNQELLNKDETIKNTNAECLKYKEDLKKRKNDIEHTEREVCTLENVKSCLEGELEVLKNSLQDEQLHVLALNEEISDTTEKGFIEASSQTMEEYENINQESQKVKLELETELEIKRKMENQLNEGNHYIKTLEEEKTVKKNEIIELNEELLHKEKKIQELTISLGEAIQKMNSQRNTAEKVDTLDEKNKPSTITMNEIFQEIKVELTYIQEDITGHKENVNTLEDKWSGYKASWRGIQHCFVKES